MKKVKNIKYQSAINAENDPRRFFVDWINNNSKVFDVGCACGDLAYTLSKEKQVDIFGLEYDEERIKISKDLNIFKEIFQENLNNFEMSKYEHLKGYFDYIVFGDVLEHILAPEKILNEFKELLKQSGCFLISLPNIAHANIKANLLLNNFDYTEEGILDKTHIKFFTYKSIAKLLTNCNLKIEDCKFTDWENIQKSQINSPFKKLHSKINKFILKDKHSFVCQYVMKAKPTSMLDELLAKNINILDSNTFISNKNITRNFFTALFFFNSKKS